MIVFVNKKKFQIYDFLLPALFLCVEQQC